MTLEEEFMKEARPLIADMLEKFATQCARRVMDELTVTRDTSFGNCVLHIDGRVGEVVGQGLADDRLLVKWTKEGYTSVVPVDKLCRLPHCPSDDCLDPVEQIANRAVDFDNADQLQRYGDALRRIMDVHPPASPTHLCAKKALDGDE